MIERKNSKALIQIDGGVDTGNIAKLEKAGADVFVVGSFIFRAADSMQTIKELAQAERN